MLFVLFAGGKGETAQMQSALESGPCAYKQIDPAKYGNKPFQNPPEVTSKGGSLNTNLVVRYTDPNTTTIGGCGVTLRSYNGELVGPTLRVKPGDVLNVLLDNQLPLETPNEVQAQFDQEAQSAHLAILVQYYESSHSRIARFTGGQQRQRLAGDSASKQVFLRDKSAGDTSIRRILVSRARSWLNLHTSRQRHGRGIDH